MTAVSPFTDTVAAPPAKFDCTISELPAGTVLHRIHDHRFGASSFNPGEGSSRFAPFEVAGSFVPTAYAATSIEAAVFETIFHDIDPSARYKSVRSSLIDNLIYSTVRVGRALRLASLFSADLMKIGIERNQLIDTPRSTYAQTRLWSPLIHEADQRPDGIKWVSRRYDEDKALMLFGTRVISADLIPLTSVKLSTDPDCIEVVKQLAQRAGITITK